MNVRGVTTMTSGTGPPPGRRDPEGRRQAIVEAAAEILLEPGHSLTHRAVAARAGVSLGSTTQYFDSLEELRATALAQLADEIDADLAAVTDDLCPLEDAPERSATVMHDFLLDTRQVRSDLALTTAAMSDPGLRELALRWSDRLTDLLAGHVGRARAHAIVLYLDGATMHAGLHDDPVSAAEMTDVIRALLAMPTDEGSDPR